MNNKCIIVLIVLIVAVIVGGVVGVSAQEQMTVKDCLLLFGDSNRVLSPSILLNLSGVDTWDSVGESVLINGDRLGYEWFETDTERRAIQLYNWQGHDYLFVFRAKSPETYIRNENGFDWHGSCLLRVGG